VHFVTDQTGDSFHCLLAALQSGDEQALNAFLAQYAPALERLAGKHIGLGMRRRVGPETVAQSVCRTFVRHVQDGSFQLDDGQQLWALLCAITCRKTQEKIRYHRRQRRDLNREQPANDDGGIVQRTSDPTPTPAEQVVFADTFETLLGQLEPEDRQIVQLKLQEKTNEEVAQELKCSERTVRRILQRLEAQLTKALKEDGR
jgi:RNA polymerase sigma factor (sigma-70 family)